MSNTAVAQSNPVLTGAVPMIGRVLIATLFILSGLSKIAAPAATIGMIQSSGLPFPILGYVGSIAVELGASTLLILGFQTRLVALGMAAFTLATAFAFHTNFGDVDQFIHFFKNISIIGGLLQVAAFGAGRFSLDARKW
jgi:putative oxidoreductase